MAFHPEEMLFAPTTRCNLRCAHCSVVRTKTSLSAGFAKRFLKSAKKIGINRVGFTGGEPFLAGNFLYDVTRFAVKEGFLFGSITTNGVWYKDLAGLRSSLEKLFKAGYDGSIYLSVDAYHEQSLIKLARFIEVANSIWKRPDLILIIYVTGRDGATKEKLSRLAQILKGEFSGFGLAHPIIKSSDFFIKIKKIDLSPIGRAERLKDPWDGRWFKEDYCKGPGNVLFVEPSGDVKPCCGYASESKALGIGNIKRDSAPKIVKNIHQNRIVYAIFNSGLSRIRKKLSDSGISYPGRTSNNCFFCHYILERHEKELDSLLNDSRSL